MLDRVSRQGLMNRMAKNFGLGDPLSAQLIVYPIASACYPKAIKSDESGILKPLISTTQARFHTEQCVDRGVGTLDDLYKTIWGVATKHGGWCDI